MLQSQGTIFTNEQKKDREKLDQLVDTSQKALLKISSIFPFDIFIDTVSIDINKVTIIYRFFFFLSILPRGALQIK